MWFCVGGGPGWLAMIHIEKAQEAKEWALMTCAFANEIGFYLD